MNTYAVSAHQLLQGKLLGADGDLKAAASGARAPGQAFASTAAGGKIVGEKQQKKFHAIEQTDHDLQQHVGRDLSDLSKSII